ncbi:Hypothetical_protein [Hexamita inflata]|uniref:Hypothetical_protein n=1 Tax=Hexamita inflata TaxID=28002 RepID=A0AA86TLF7_9EUKA|nr:Hypothetical protein HINF_LOCUS9809 [Hexamita inflata]CAI9978084.1 Hypothetical protein HINF_LOCUS65729 [Hexamita inflata]
MIGVHPQVIFDLAAHYIKETNNLVLLGRQQHENIEINSVQTSVSATNYQFKVCFKQTNEQGKICVFSMKDKQYLIQFYNDQVLMKHTLIANENERNALKFTLEQAMIEAK